jgi:hypothetical protein
VEANWTVPAIVALIVLSHQYISDNQRFQRWVFNMLAVTLAIVLIFRIYLVMDVKGSTLVKKDEFHQNKTWAALIKEKSGGLPLVSVSSYQKASKYWFYTGIQSYSLNTPEYRRNNYNYWPVSDSLLGKTVYVLGGLNAILKDEIPGRGNQVNGGGIIDSFFSFSKLQFTKIKNVKAKDGVITLECTVDAPEHYLEIFQEAPYKNALVQLAIVNNDTLPDNFSSAFKVDRITNTQMNLQLSFPVPINKGEYFGRLGTESRVPEHPTLNSATFKVNME